jgi:RNA polymerase sigma factor (sigma-70 family)
MDYNDLAKDFTGEELTALISTEGPETALMQMYSRFNKILSKRVIRVLTRKRCSDPISHAEDISQLSWMTVISDFKRYHEGLKSEPYLNPLGWLITISQHLCYQHAKKELPLISENVSLDFDLIDENSYLSRKSHERDLESKETIERILDRLPEESKTIVRLFIDGYTHKEIAERLNTTPDSSRQRVSRAMRQIRKSLENGKF